MIGGPTTFWEEGPKGWGPKKGRKGQILPNFCGFAFYSQRTETDFKDRVDQFPPEID